MNDRVRKMAERPHFWTVVLSSVALVLTLIGLWQANRAYKLNSAVGRANVEVSAVKLVSRPEEAAFLRYDVSLINFGQAAARNINIYSQFQISTVPIPMPDYLYQHPSTLDIAPKSSQTIPLQSNIRFSNHHSELDKALKNKLLIFGFTQYTDEATGIQTKDPWCFLYDPADSEEVRTLELRRCEYRP
jgi:hypothetical protein